MSGLYYCITILVISVLNLVAAAENVKFVSAIDVFEDIAANNFTADCDYFTSIPVQTCHNKTIEHGNRVGFWGGCNHCYFTYYKQPGESLIGLEYQFFSTQPNPPQYYYHYPYVRALLENGEVRFEKPAVPGSLSQYIDFGDRVVVDKIQSLQIYVPRVGYEYAYLDRMVLYKRPTHVSIRQVVDVQADLEQAGWVSACAYETNLAEFICKGEHIGNSTEYEGTGFWAACDQFCSVSYQVQPGETLEKFEIFGYFNKPTKSSGFAPLNLYITYDTPGEHIELNFLPINGHHQVIDFSSHVADVTRIKRLQLGVSQVGSPSIYRSYALLDRVVLQKRVDTIN
jgi:hypothetical protein